MNLSNLIVRGSLFGSTLIDYHLLTHHNCLKKRNFQTVSLENGKPSLLIAHTIKGKGVREMEDRLEWHYKSPSDIEVDNFIKQLGGNQ